MQYTNVDKTAIKENRAKIYSRISVLGTNYVFTEDDYISEWTYEDYRYVPDTGFIGQFVERILDGSLFDVPEDCYLEGATLKLELGIKTSDNLNPNYYDYGNFIVTSVTYSDTEGKTSFQSADYTKLFNETYLDTIEYPCTSLQLLENVCNQVGVQLDGNGTTYTYCVKEGEDGVSYNLLPGEYSFNIDDIYYNFSIDEELQPHDVISLTKIDDEIKLIVKTVRLNNKNEYEIKREELEYETSDSELCDVLGVTPSINYEFENNDYVLFGNYFDGDVSCRDVVRAIAQLGYTWARINENNKLCLDFDVKTINDIEEHNFLDTNEYFESKAENSVFGPVTKVVIGLSAAEGENIVKIGASSDGALSTEDGEIILTEFADELVAEGTSKECTIQIWDNPLTYTETLRRIAINGSERLFGLTYQPITIKSIGHPWLEANDYISFTNLDDTTSYTYPFNRRIEYTGYIVEDLSSDALTMTDQKYEYQSSQIDKIKKTTITVDKMNGRITSLVKDYNGVSSQLSKVEQDVNKIQNVFQIQGGINLIKNSALLLNDEVWEFHDEETGYQYHTKIGEAYSSAYIGNVISNSEIKLRDTSMVSIVGLNNILINSPKSTHTFSFMYRMDNNTTATVRLVNDTNNIVVWSMNVTSAQKELKRVVTDLIIPNTQNLRLEIDTHTTNEGYFYIYDLMLNVGEKQDWSPASDEIISTCIRLSQLGITVLAKGSKFATIMSSTEFAIYEASYNGDEVKLGQLVTSFDDAGMLTKFITSTGISTGRYVLEERTWDGVEHHIEYFKEG